MNNTEQNQQSLLSLMNFLLHVIENASDYKDDEDLKLALKSQGALAKYKNSEHNIIACSLNTQKSGAEALLSDGFNELNQRRKKALIALEMKVEDKNRSNKQTRSGLIKKVEELENDVLILQKRNVLLSSIVSNMSATLENFARESQRPDLLSQLEDKQREIEAKLSYVFDGEI